MVIGTPTPQDSPPENRRIVSTTNIPTTRTSKTEASSESSEVTTHEITTPNIQTTDSSGALEEEQDLGQIRRSSPNTQQQHFNNKPSGVKCFQRSDDNLKLPKNLKVGQAIADGNCFFDAFRQGVEQQKGIKETVERLREYCKEFVQDDPPEWFVDAIANSHDNSGEVRMETPGSYAGNILNSDRWGDSEVEGRILSGKYEVKLHVIEKHDVDGKEVITHQIIDSRGSKSVNVINYKEKNTIHIVNRGNGHFDPVLTIEEIENHEQSSDFSDLTLEEELIYTIKSRDSVEKKVTKIRELLREEPKLNINYQDPNTNDTPLHIALRKKEPELKVIELLVTIGASIDMKNKNDRTSLEIANNLKKQNIIQMLERPSASKPVNEQFQHKIGQRGQQPSRHITARQQEQPQNRNKTNVNNKQDKHAKQRDPIHGNIYQLKILLLFCCRGVSHEYSFRLGTEVEQAKKFDDLVFEYTTKDNNKIYYRLLQAKHRQQVDDSKKITAHQLLTEKDGDFSLAKYFFSYQGSKKDEFFKSGSIKDVILFTNIDFDINDLNNKGIEIEEVGGEDEILNLETGVRYRFKKDVTSLLKPILQECGLPKLAQRLAKCFLENSPIKEHDENDIFQFYQAALAEEVFNTKTKKIHDKFIKSADISERAKEFRNYFEKEIKRQSKDAVTLENINEAILEKRNINKRQVGLNLSKNFGKGVINWTSHDVPDDEIEDFLNHLVFAVNQPSEEELGEIVKAEIRKILEIDFIIEENIFNKLFMTMLDWFQGKDKDRGFKGLPGEKGRFISYEGAKKFFDKAKQEVFKLQLIGSTLKYSKNIEKLIEEFRINFKQDAIRGLSLKDFLTSQSSNYQIFNVITEQDKLSVIKVYQILKDMYQDDSYILLPLNSVLSLQRKVVEVFRGNTNLLVIQCKPTESNIEDLYKNLRDILEKKDEDPREKPNKKIILITHLNNALAAKFKKDFSGKYEYIEKKDEKNSLVDFTFESKKKLLEIGTVIFQGKKVNLGKLIAQEDLEENPKLTESIDGEVCSKLIQKQEIEIGRVLQDLGEVENYYIDRKSNRQVKIKKAFEEETSRFTFTDNSEITESNPEQDIVLISVTANHFNELCKKYKTRNIHWLIKESQGFIWQQSQGALSNLLEFVDTKVISEYPLKDTTSIADKVVVISAEPGMGKSTILTKLAQETKNYHPSLWVVRINLNDHTKSLNEIDFNEEKFQSDIVGLKTPLEKELFKFRMNHGKIVLLFDGFDDISPTYGNKVIELLQNLKNTKVEKLWVTTRPHLHRKLEDKLSVFSYTLKPFSQENKEQEIFFKKFWKRSLGFSEINEERFVVYSKKFLHLISQSIRDEERVFTGVPLQTRLLAEAFEEDFKKFYHSDQDKPSLPRHLDLGDLYQRFIKIKYKIYCKEKKKQDDTNVATVDDENKLYNIFIQKHEKLALHTLILEKDLSKLLSKDEVSEVARFIKNIEQGNEKTGIINQINGGRPSFIHRTFAEYFAAEWFADNRNQEKHEVKNWLREKIFNEENKVLRNFFDRILTKNNCDVNEYNVNAETVKKDEYKLHNAALNNDEKTVKNLLADTRKVENIIDGRDKGGRTALHLAAAYGYSDMVQILLGKNADLSIADKIFDWRPLSYADKSSYWNVAEALLKKNANGDDMFKAIDCVQSFEKEKERLLHIAAREGYVKFAEVLLKKEAVLNAIDEVYEDGKSPLHLAAENGHLDVVELLVNTGANIDINSSIGAPYRRRPSKWTPLHWAVFNEHVSVIKFLLSKKAKILEDSEGLTPLKRAVNNLEIFELLGGSKEDLPANDAIESSIRSNNLNLFKKLTEGTDYSKMSKWSYLHIAASLGSLEIVQFLIDEGARIDGDETSSTPLTAAAAKGYLEIVKYLIERGANINTGGTDGWTALHAAARGSPDDPRALREAEPDYLEVLKYFIDDLGKEKGVNIEISDKKGTTPLQSAAHHNRFRSVKYLVARGANINAIDKLGATIVFSAAFNNNCEIVKFLIGKGAMINANEGILGKLHITVLHIASMYNSLEIVKLLVEKEANVNAGKDISLTPLHLAALSDNKETIEYLIERGADVNVAVKLNTIGKFLTQEKALEDSSMQVVIIRIRNFLSLPVKILSFFINVTPKNMSRLFGCRNELLEKKSDNGLMTRIWDAFTMFVADRPKILKHLNWLKDFITKRKANNLESLPQECLLYLPDSKDQAINYGD